MKAVTFGQSQINLLLPQSFCYSSGSTVLAVFNLDRHQGKNKMTPSPAPARFNSAHFRARMVKILLIIGAIATAFSIVVETISLPFLTALEEQDVADDPAAAVVVLVVFLFAVVELIIYITTVVFFVMWLYRAYSNLRAFDPLRPLDHSPGWAAGSFFVPFANLIIPYRAVRETWQKSGPADETLFAEPKPPLFFPVWWLFWILASIAGNIAMRASFSGNVDLTTVTMTSVTASVLSIVAAFFAYMVVNAIDKRQEETSERIKLGRFAEPPPPPTSLPMPGVVAPAP